MKTLAAIYQIYGPQLCDEVVTLGQQGMTFTEIAAHLGVPRRKLREWANQNPEFDDAITIAMEAAQAAILKTAREGMAGKIEGYNNPAAKMLLEGLWPDEWRPKKDDVLAPQLTIEILDHRSMQVAPARAVARMARIGVEKTDQEIEDAELVEAMK